MTEDKEKPQTAPGDYDFLAADATGKEKKKKKFTRVTRLSLDESEPS